MIIRSLPFLSVQHVSVVQLSTISCFTIRYQVTLLKYLSNRDQGIQFLPLPGTISLHLLFFLLLMRELLTVQPFYLNKFAQSGGTNWCPTHQVVRFLAGNSAIGQYRYPSHSCVFYVNSYTLKYKKKMINDSKHYFNFYSLNTYYN